jgi:hypothetical protein
MRKFILVTGALLVASSQLALAKNHTPRYGSGNYSPHVMQSSGIGPVTKEAVTDPRETGSIRGDRGSSNSDILQQAQPTRSSIPERPNDPR